MQLIYLNTSHAFAPGYITKHYFKDITHFRKCCKVNFFPPGLKKFVEAIPKTKGDAIFFPPHNARVKHKNKEDIT